MTSRLFTVALGVILALVGLTGCTRSASVGAPPVVANEPVIRGLRIAFTSLVFAAGAQNTYVDSLRADKQITKKEAEEFKRWTKNVPEITKQALTVLDGTAETPAKLLAVGRIVATIEKPLILESMSPKTKAAYMAITAVLAGIEAQVVAQP